MKNIVLKSFEETIAAGDQKNVLFYSQMLTILENSAGDEIDVGIGEMQPTQLRAGIQYELPQGDTFNRLTLYNKSASETTVKFILSVGRIYDNRLTISGSAFDNILKELTGDTTPENWGEQTIGLAQSQVLASNTDRKSYSIQAKSTNTGIVYVGYDNTVASNKWFAELQPGQSCGGDDYRGPIHAIATVADQKCGVSEV
jgi:hypothetical protein